LGGVLLVAQGHVSRLPVDLAWLRRKTDAAYQTENALFRHMLCEFRPLAWCREISVIADAVYASQPNMRLIQELGDWYVLAMPRTWKFTNGQALKEPINPLPRWWDPRICVPTVNGQRWRTCWVDAKRVRRRQLGDVTVGLGTCRCHEGRKQTQILVPNLPEAVTARQIEAIDLRRWGWSGW
jgi:hypothetical protein